MPLIEAMACGTPSIYSDCSGQLEFAKGKGIPVKIKNEVAVSEFYPEGTPTSGNWYEPDFQDLEDKMIEVYNNYDYYKKKALQESIEIRDRFSWENSAEIAKNIIEKSYGSQIEKIKNLNKESFSLLNKQIYDKLNEQLINRLHIINQLKSNNFHKSNELKDIKFDIFLTPDTQKVKLFSKLLEIRKRVSGLESKIGNWDIVKIHKNKFLIFFRKQKENQ